METVKKLRDNKALQILSVIFALIFPALMLGGSFGVVIHYVWIAFYSVLFVFLIQKNKAVRFGLLALNVISVVILVLFFLMGGTEIIAGVIAKAVIPFWENPWLR